VVRAGEHRIAERAKENVAYETEQPFLSTFSKQQRTNVARRNGCVIVQRRQSRVTEVYREAQHTTKKTMRKEAERETMEMGKRETTVD
jgi:hypothetical protein